MLFCVMIVDDWFQGLSICRNTQPSFFQVSLKKYMSSRLGTVLAIQMLGFLYDISI